MKCPSCARAKLVRDTRDIPYTYKGETTTIPAVRGDFCPACGESVLAAAESSRVSAAMLEFNKQVNASIVDPGFIARVRKKLALDQRQAAAIFGGGTNAFSRYGSGAGLLEAGALRHIVAAAGFHDPVAEHGGVTAGLGVGAKLLDGEPHLPSPVRVLPGGRGEVLLVKFLGEVFLVNRQQLRRGKRQETDDGVVQRAAQFGPGGGRARCAGRQQFLRE